MQNAKCKMRNEERVMDNIIEKKSFDFVVRIVKLYKLLCEEKRQFILSKQLLLILHPALTWR